MLFLWKNWRHNGIFEIFAVLGEDPSCYFFGCPRSVCAAREDSRHKFTIVLDERCSTRGVFSSIRTLFLLGWKILVG